MRELSHIEKIEAGIVAALKNGLHAEFLIDHFPDNPGEYDFKGARNAALVQYAGSAYTKPASQDANKQKRAAEYVVHLYRAYEDQDPGHRNISGGAKDIEQIRLALQGRRIEGCELFMIRDGLVGKDSGMWRYEITIGAVLPAVGHLRHAPAITPSMSGFHSNQGA